MIAYETRRLALACASGALAAMTAQATLVYDHLIAASSLIATPNIEYAERITLAPGPSTITSARMRLGLSALTPDAGTITLSFYADAAGTPGTLLFTSSQSVSVASVSTLVDFTGLSVAAPSPMWISSRFVSTGPGTGGSRLSIAAPLVGSVDSTRMVRTGGVGSWTAESTNRWIEIQLDSVPTPGSLALLALGGMVGSRRRR